MSRSSHERKAFILSLALHGLVVVGFAISLIWSRFSKELPPVHVFELVEPTPFQQSAPSAPSAIPPQPQVPQEQIKLPEMPKLDQRKVEIPDPAPEPEPPPPPKPEPKPQPKPEPKPEPKPQVKELDYSQFLKENKLPKTAQPKPARPKPVAAPKIDISDIKRDLQQNLSTADSARVSQMSAAAQSQLYDYFSQVRSRLDANFIRPDGLPYQEWKALVQFQIEPNGTVTNVRLLNSSGSSNFDNAVLETFRRTRLPPTPDGQRYVRKIPFTVMAD